MISSPVKTKPRTRTYAVSKDDDMEQALISFNYILIDPCNKLLSWRFGEPE